jgi:hypothetical protein
MISEPITLTTAATVAAVLRGLGGALTRLLHISTGALSVASDIILLIIAIRMVLGQDTWSRIACLLPNWCSASCSRPSSSTSRSTGIPILA